MSEKDNIDLILTLANDVWQNWGFLITVNVALVGWLIHRHGLYSSSEKIIASLAYSAFLVVILLGMQNTYMKLDYAANELAFRYVNAKEDHKNISPKGIVMYYVSRSPD